MLKLLPIIMLMVLPIHATYYSNLLNVLNCTESTEGCVFSLSQTVLAKTEKNSQIQQMMAEVGPLSCMHRPILAYLAVYACG